MHTPLIPLSEAETDKQYYICEVNLRKNLAAKLYKLGVFAGETLTVERKIGKSTLILNVGGARVAAGREIAEKITVCLLPNGENHDKTSR